MTTDKMNERIRAWGGGTVSLTLASGEVVTLPAVVLHINARGNVAWFEPAYLDSLNSSPAYREGGPLLRVLDDAIVFKGGQVTPPIDEHKAACAWWFEEAGDPVAEAASAIASVTPPSASAA